MTTILEVEGNIDLIEDKNLLSNEDLNMVMTLVLMIKIGFFDTASVAHDFIVRKFEDEVKEPWFVDHTIKDNVPTVLLYRKQEHAGTGKAVLTIKEQVA